MHFFFLLLPCLYLPGILLGILHSELVSVYFWYAAHHSIAVFLTASSVPPSTEQNWECYKGEDESLKELAMKRGNKTHWWMESKVQNERKAFGYCGAHGSSHRSSQALPPGSRWSPVSLSKCSRGVYLPCKHLVILFSCRTGIKSRNSAAQPSPFTTAKQKTEYPKLVKNSSFNTILQKWILAACAHQTPALTLAAAFTVLQSTVQIPPG